MATVRQGEAQGSDKSVQTFVTGLVTYAALGALQFGAFLILRKRNRAVYEGRSTLNPTGPKQKPLPSSLLAPVSAVLRTSDEDIIKHNGLDAYFFVRFQKVMAIFFLATSVVTWAVLLPVYGTGTGGNTGMNRFTFGNIGPQQRNRYAAPCVLAALITFALLYVIWKEWKGYIEKRAEFLTSRSFASKPASRTVLLSGLPKEMRSEEAVANLTSYLQGGVAKIWMARNVDDLADVYERQMKAAQKLEKSDLKVIKLALKKVKKGKVSESGNSEMEKEDHLGSRYIPEKKYPTHRLGKIPFIGKKVETIPWAEQEIEQTQKDLNEGRQDFSKFEVASSAFILFNDQMDAHRFAQRIGEDTPKKLRLAARYINVDSEDVVWGNLSRNAAANKGGRILSVAACIAITILWVPLTTFVTGIANVNKLAATVPFLGWLANLPVPVNGIIQGALPPLVLIVLFMLVPIVFRQLIKRLEGVPLNTQVELKLQKRFFGFLFIQGFLIATLASGIVAAISQITQEPSQAAQLLANQLPSANVFFLTYLALQGFSKAFAALLQVAKLVLYYVKVKFLGGNPRSLYNARYGMPANDWGTAFPSQILLAVIALSYSTIAPLVVGFASFAFFMFYFIYKYMALYCFDIPPEGETGGVFFKTALNQLFAGIYIYLLCLIGLFFLTQGPNGGRAAPGEGGTIIGVLIICIAFQIWINWKYRKTSMYLDTEGSAHKQRATRITQDSASDGGRPSQDSGNLQPVGSRNSETTAVGRTAGIKGPKNNAEAENGHNIDSTLDSRRADGPDPNAFEHPALWRDQPTVWLPRDDLGLSEEAVQRGRRRNILIANEDASIDKNGKVDIQTDELPGEDFQPNL